MANKHSFDKARKQLKNGKVQLWIELLNEDEEKVPKVAYISRDNTSYKSGLYLFTSISLFLLNDTSELSDPQKSIKETKNQFHPRH